MSLTPNDHTIEKELRDIKRRISALERANNSVGDLSELAGSLTMGDGNVIIDDDGIAVVQGNTGFQDVNSYRFINSGGTYLGSMFFNENSNLGLEVYHDDDISSTISINSRTANTAISRVSMGAYRYNNSNPPAYFSAALGTGGTPTGTIEISAGDQGTITLGRPYGATVINLNGPLGGWSQTLADDEATSFTPACARGILILRGPGSDSTTYAMLTYAATAGTAYAYAWVNGSNTVVTTGALTGTTGTDGKLTISAHTDGKIYIENRRGGSRGLAWNIVAGA